MRASICLNWLCFVGLVLTQLDFVHVAFVRGLHLVSALDYVCVCCWSSGLACPIPPRSWSSWFCSISPWYWSVVVLVWTRWTVRFYGWTESVVGDCHLVLSMDCTEWCNFGFIARLLPCCFDFIARLLPCWVDCCVSALSCSVCVHLGSEGLSHVVVLGRSGIILFG
jgi:hypothetical protein